MDRFSWKKSYLESGTRSGLSILLIALLIVFVLLVGMTVAIVTPENIMRGLRAARWQKVQCTVASLMIEQGTGKKPVFHISLRYHFRGREYQAEQRIVAQSPYAADRHAEFYKPGTLAQCFVNPLAPSESMLVEEAGDFEAFLVIIISGIIVIGITGIVLGFQGIARSRPISLGSLETSSNVIKYLKMAGAVCVIIFGSVCFYYAGIRSFARVWESVRFVPVECVIRICQIEKVREGERLDYRLSLAFSYRYDDTEYEGRKYWIWDGDPSLSSDLQKVVERFKAGDRVQCWVNPRNPVDAVLDRHVSWSIVGGLVPLLVALSGIRLLVGIARGKPYPEQAPSPECGEKREQADMYELEQWRSLPGKSRVFMQDEPPGRMWPGSLSATLISAGICAVRGYLIWMPHGIGWMADQYFIVFGILAVAGGFITIRYWLLSRLLYSRLTLSTGVPVLGETFRVEWKLERSARIMQDFRMILQLKESVKDPHSEAVSLDEVFYCSELISTPLLEQDTVKVEALIPREMVPSFYGHHNRLIWELLVTGKMGRFLPPVNERYEVLVLPPSEGGADK